ncbi:MAG: isochorismatase family protein [Planctomycetaceae bacterium]
MSHRVVSRCGLINAAWIVTILALTASARGADEPKASEADDLITLRVRKQVAVEGTSGEYRPVVRTERWRPAETAIIVCDMWDTHTSENAARRVAEMAPRMNRVLATAREQGLTIIHAPSNCMEFYADHPARKHALETPRAEELPQDIGKWCHQIPAEEQGEYPLDQSDSKDDDPERLAKWTEQLREQGRNVNRPWIRQIDTLTIHDSDYISDDGEQVWSILEHRGIDNVILLGVHTNMCVLGRPFGLRQMSKNGKNVVLMRDMTDTMYNPRQRPFVSHFTGTDLIIEHIEKYVCPTVASVALLGGKEFRFAGDTRPHVVIVMAEDEYQTEHTLPEFARKHLGQDFKVSYVHADPEAPHRLANAAEIKRADVLLISVRRRPLPPRQMKLIRAHVAAGKPVVGIRTASHAFALRNGEVPEGREDWPEWDRDVIGGNYTNHHGNGPVVIVRVADGAEDHPILKGIDVSQLKSYGSLYKNTPLQQTAAPLLIGTIPNQQPEPVAWINKRADGGKTFYTSMGHAKDFEQLEFNELLKNGIAWAAGLEAPEAKTAGAAD